MTFAQWLKLRYSAEIKPRDVWVCGFVGLLICFCVFVFEMDDITDYWLGLDVMNQN